MKTVVVFAMMVLASVTRAGTITNTFESLTDPTSANGLEVLGVLFQFSGGTATYGLTIGTTGNGLSPLSDPVLEGPTSGTLTLQFLQATTFLSFDFALVPVDSKKSDGVKVVLSGPNFSDSGPWFGETGDANLFGMGSFSYSGSPFTQAILTFSSDAQRFAIDNLSYDPPEASVPEPGPGALAVCGLLLIVTPLVRARRVTC